MFDNRIRNFLIISFISLLVSRLIPHPPNFTTTITVAFYLPGLFGLKYLFVTLIAFMLSDLILGMHNLILFTWGSIILIGLFSKFFNNYYFRLIGVTGSCLIFFLISNFGVWFLSHNILVNLGNFYNIQVHYLFISSICQKHQKKNHNSNYHTKSKRTITTNNNSYMNHKPITI